MYGLVKLAALSAALAAALVTMTESPRGRTAERAADRVTIDSAPNSRNAPLATDPCLETARSFADGSCSTIEALFTRGRLQVAAADTREASGIRTIVR